MKTPNRPPAPTVSERGRGVAAIASRRQCAGGRMSLRGWAGTPSCSSLPTHIFRSSSFIQALLDARERLAHEASDRVQVVAALLHHDGRQAERAEDRKSVA